MLDTHIAWAVATRPSSLTLMLLTLALTAAAWRRGGATRALFVLALGTVLAATTTTWRPHPSLGGVERYLLGFEHPGAAVRGFAGTRERIANIVLFVPLGVFGTLLTRRPWCTLAACGALTFAIEGWQGYLGRTADVSDVLHNAAGAAVGAGLALAWTRAAAGPGRAECLTGPPRSSP
jgi:hypothetical protein